MMRFLMALAVAAVLVACAKPAEPCVARGFPRDEGGHLISAEKAVDFFSRLHSTRASIYEAWRGDIGALKTAEEGGTREARLSAVENLQDSQGALRLASRKLLVFVIYNKDFLAERKLVDDPEKLAVKLVEDLQTLQDAEVRLQVSRLTLIAGAPANAPAGLPTSNSSGGAPLERP